MTQDTAIGSLDFGIGRTMQPQSMPAVHQRQRAARKHPHERLEQVQSQPPCPETSNLLAPLRDAKRNPCFVKLVGGTLLISTA
jgi:hypothetical protein